MLERVEVWINYTWMDGSLIRETDNIYVVRLDATGKDTACSKRQVRRWMRSE